jgi:predicted  nucleic acid-binding Zn-ribbon protein
MTQQRRTALKELQKLDLQIQKARTRIHDFDPLLEEVEQPALVLESELGSSRNRLKEMKLESRRLELAAEERLERRKRLDERLKGVRNLREEAAVSAELEMVKRALQNDEQEAFTLIDQIRKVEERLAEVETAFDGASALVEPKRNELLQQREDAKSELESLERDRDGFVARMPEHELRTYEAIRAGGRRVAVAELTDDGACSNCFGVIPLQLQNEIRHGESLIRCEGCGVILAAPEPESERAAERPTPRAADAATHAEAADDFVGEGNEPAGATAARDSDREEGSEEE